MMTHLSALPLLLLLVQPCALGDETAQAEAPTEARTPPLVELAPVRTSSAREEATLHGVVQAAERATLAFSVAGRLEERSVDLGDRVRAGQVLARLDARGYQHAIVAAEAGLAEVEARSEQLQRDEARARALRQSGVASAADVEATATGREALAAGRVGARAQLAEARRQRRETVLRAPFDGVVRAVLQDEGAVVSPGAPLLLLATEAADEVHAQAPEAVAAWLRVGTEAEVELPATGERLTATFLAVSDAADLAGLFPVRLRLEGEARDGSGAVLRLRGPPGDPELRVPVRAVLDPSGDRPFVWRVRGGRAERVPIEVGALRTPPGGVPELAVEAETLRPGDRVIVAGQRPLLDGDRVEPLPRDARPAQGEAVAR